MRRLMPLLLLATAPAWAATDVPPPAQLGLCAACHREDGRAGEPGVPRIAGQDETYLRDALNAYRRGQREHSAMRAIAGALSDRDVEAFARWYSTRPACAPP
jgi:cytochrome c553